MTDLAICPSCGEHGVVSPNKIDKFRPYCLRCGWVKDYDSDVRDTILPAFNRWWNKDELSCTNPYWYNTPAYWAWEGWYAATKYMTEDK